MLATASSMGGFLWSIYCKPQIYLDIVKDQRKFVVASKVRSSATTASSGRITNSDHSPAEGALGSS